MVCIRRRACPVRFPPSRCSLFRGGEVGRNYLGCPGTAPWGGGGVQLHFYCGGRRLPPLRAAPKGWGWGSTDVPCSPPPPAKSASSGGGGGSMPSPVVDDPAVSRQEMSPKVSANPQERGGGDEDAVVPPPPTRGCLSGRPAGAHDACSRSPCASPCPAVPLGESGEGLEGLPQPSPLV